MSDITIKELQNYNDTQREIIERQQAEIERLRGEVALRKAQQSREPFCPDHRDKVRGLPCRECEIERLHTLLREMLEDGYVHVPYGASHEDVSAILDFEKRVREALGE